MSSPSVSVSAAAPPKRYSAKTLVLMGLGATAVLAVLAWQAVVAHGAPDPTAHGLSRSAMALSSAILVFREGLEAVLVLAAVTAGLARQKPDYWPPVLMGIGAALASTVVTWFIAVAAISAVNAPELQIQAVTGVVAIIVLLVVMNWFFHKLYWTGWICHHCQRRRNLFEGPSTNGSKVVLGLAMLGFTAIYREGFEVVLFLQDLRLKAGSGLVLSGAGIGVALTAVVAVLTFAAHRRLPYRQMLILTGVLLAGVLLVMVGESTQELQLAGWLPSHPVAMPIPEWMGVWFATFPNAEGLGAQAFAAATLLGSYAWVRSRVPKGAAGEPVTAGCEVNTLRG